MAINITERERALDVLHGLMEETDPSGLEDYWVSLWEDNLLFNIFCQFGVDNWDSFAEAQIQFEELYVKEEK